MYQEIYKLFYGEYRFTAEVDTGAEVGIYQINVWYSKKTAIEQIPLTNFRLDQLLAALDEPLRTQYAEQLEVAKSSQRKLSEEAIAALQHPYQGTKEQPARKKKLPGQVKRQIRGLRKQVEATLKQLEREFVRDKLLVLDRDCFNLDVLAQLSQEFGENHFLRSFYFEEANDNNIRTFCRDFALNADLRQEVLCGQRRWAKRNKLFVRNLPNLLREEELSENEGNYYRRARELFRWFDLHAEEILALPEYQRLQAVDSAFQPGIHEIDPLIQPAVTLLNEIPGSVTKFSCQGITGKVRFAGQELLVDSPHEEYAYVSFERLSYFVHDSILQRLPDFSSITTEALSYHPVHKLAVRSTGDNIRFRTELQTLAQEILQSIENSAVPTKSAVDVAHTEQPELQRDGNTSAAAPLYWEAVLFPERLPPKDVPGGILPGRLAWLCQPSQIEHTLYLLSLLNYWARARDRLRYHDRRGLFTLKTALLKQAYIEGLITPTTYVDGSERFSQGLHLEHAALMATDYFLDRLSELFSNGSKINIGKEDEWDTATRKLCSRILGFELSVADDMEQLKPEHITVHILVYLQDLVKQAQKTRQPIPTSELMALFISPTDLLEVPHFLSDWQDLDAGDLSKLDPEGGSVIVFVYESSTAQYTFQLPYRIALQFISDEHRQQLNSRNGKIPERADFHSVTITEDESLHYLPKDILRELAVNVASICPHMLISKQKWLEQRNWYGHYGGKELEEDEAERQLWGRPECFL